MKKYINFFAIAFLMLFASYAKGQQVISSAGVSGSNTSGSISSTVGELVIDTKTASGKTITQGFHQTKLTITGIKELQGLSFKISISPNPTSDYAQITIDKIETPKLTYIMFDIQGKAVLNGEIVSGKAEISFMDRNAGSYIVKVMQEGKQIKTVKIIKQ